jgi:hypothetical protein
MSRELFKSYTDPVFDPLGAAESAASMTMRLLLNKERAARLVDYKARDADNLGLGDMLDKIINRSWKAPVEEGYESAIQNVVNHVALYHMMSLAADEEASSQVRSIANLKLEALREWMRIEAEEEAETEQRAASLLYGYRILQQFKDKGKTFTPAEPLSPPPGSPIGGGDLWMGCTL